jgi:AcrR family transcriptional regulator
MTIAPRRAGNRSPAPPPRKRTPKPGRPHSPAAGTPRDRGAETRAQLIDAALDVFGELGFDGASTRLIASRAGVNLAAIVYHFGGKGELHLAVARHITESVAANIGPALAAAAMPASLAGPDAARATILHTLGILIDVILGKAEAARWARFIVREQMNPGAAFDVLYEFLGGAHALAARVFAAALGKPENDEIRLRVFAILGQVMFFRVAPAVVLRRMNWRAIDDARRAEIKRIVLGHVEDIILAERNK